MDFSYSPTQQSIIDAIDAIMADFDDDYWLAADRDGRFPEEFYAAIAAGGWLGIAMPEAYGGAALGIAEAALMMQKIAETGGGMAAASAVHINIFGPHPIVVYGTEEQRSAWLPPLIKGEVKCCFGVTEPDAGLDTGNIRTRADKIDGGYLVSGQKIWTSTAQVASKILLLARTSQPSKSGRRTDGLTLFYTDLDRSHIEVREIAKMGRAAVDSNQIFIDGLIVPEAHRIGEEGKGFSYLLDSLNPERILIAAEALGIGKTALRRALNMLVNASCLTGRLARINQSNTRLPKIGSNWKRQVCLSPRQRIFMTAARRRAAWPMRRNILLPKPDSRPQHRR